MSVGYLLQRYAGLERRRIILVSFHRSHEAPALILSFQHLTAGLEVGIQFRQLGPEVIERTSEIFIGHKQMLLDIVLLYLIASLTGQDDQFADDIRTAEVDTWVRFTVALFLGTADSL